MRSWSAGAVSGATAHEVLVAFPLGIKSLQLGGRQYRGQLAAGLLVQVFHVGMEGFELFLVFIPQRVPLLIRLFQNRFDLLGLLIAQLQAFLHVGQALVRVGSGMLRLRVRGHDSGTKATG